MLHKTRMYQIGWAMNLDQNIEAIIMNPEPQHFGTIESCSSWAFTLVALAGTWPASSFTKFDFIAPVTGARR